MLIAAFEVMYDEWQRDGPRSGLMRIRQTEYMTDETHLQIYEEHPDVSGGPERAAITGELMGKTDEPRADLGCLYSSACSSARYFPAGQTTACPSRRSR
jgi:hypothetical protein